MSVRPGRHRTVHLLAPLLLVGAFALAGTVRADGERARGARKVERYPASFRLAVQEAIEGGIAHLRGLQKETGHWGDPAHPQALGHTGLPALALLKMGVALEDEAVQRAFRAMRTLPLDKTYSAGCYLMAIQARYQPALDTFDTDVGTLRAKRVRPKEVRAQLSKEDLAALERGVAFLTEAQNARGLWHYAVQDVPNAQAYDLSNTQYALLGLRAAADCGVKVKTVVWRDALRGLLDVQDPKGETVDLIDHVVRDGYAFRRKDRAEVRGFRYTDGRKDGPLGEKTVFKQPLTASMTVSGVACVMICTEGLWRSRRFSGTDRKQAAESVRDGLAWLQQNFSVAENVGHPRGAHHLYYLYGLERMAMLTGRRWIGAHDWYREGADLLLEQQGAGGGWGSHVATSFAILFLKRATRPPALTEAH